MPKALLSFGFLQKQLKRESRFHIYLYNAPHQPGLRVTIHFAWFTSSAKGPKQSLADFSQMQSFKGIEQASAPAFRSCFATNWRVSSESVHADLAPFFSSQESNDEARAQRTAHLRCVDADLVGTWGANTRGLHLNRENASDPTLRVRSRSAEVLTECRPRIVAAAGDSVTRTAVVIVID